MRNTISLALFTTLLSVSTISLLPQAPLLISNSYASEATSDLVTCHPATSESDGMHADLHAHMQIGPGMEMQKSMEHNNHHDHGGMMHHDTPKHHEHDKELQKQHDEDQQPKMKHNHQKQIS